MRSIKLLTGISLFFLFFPLFGQNDFKSEEELKERANELFEQRQFEEASPLFAQLLSLYPQDPNYNYKYAATLLSTSADREKPLKYLKFAISKSSQVDPLAYYFLGKAFHLNYNFSDAVKYYNRFKQKGDNKTVEEFAVERQAEMAKNGRKMLGRLNEVQVIEKQTVPRKDFFRVYQLEGIDGKLIAKPEDFRSKYDEKMDERSVIYLPNNAKEVYYSSYGKKGDQGKDIYKAVKLGNNNWSDPVLLGPSVNTPYDEDYPFIHPDGRTLFFASEGHSSIGGYDLFKSTYDQASAEWTEPVNLDFAFSTVDDDILFITDTDQTIAYFASDRANVSGEITVYKVLVDKAPANLSVIKGKFIAENQAELKSAKITVIEEASQQTVGVYETDSEGNYQVEIASNGGNYRFNLETTADAPIHTGAVEIPKQDEFAVLGQELRLVGSGDEQQLVIKNIFDGSSTANTTGPNISSATLKMKANLDVNVDQAALASAISEKENEASDATEAQDNSGGVSEEGNYSEAQIGQLKSEIENKAADLYRGSQKAYKSAAELKAQADKAFAEANVNPKEKISEAEANKNEKLSAARELASRAAIMTAMAQKMEKESVQADQLVENLSEETEELATKGQDENATKAVVDKYASQSASIPLSQEYLDRYQQQLQSTMDLERSALKAEETKLNSLKADSKRIAEEIAELESGTAPAENQKQQLSDLKTDQDDLQFQIKSTQLDLDLKRTELAALDLENKEVDNLIGRQDEKPGEIQEADKQQMVSELKSYRDNRQLAYMPPKNNEDELSVPSEEYVNDEISSPEMFSMRIDGIRSAAAMQKDFEDQLASTSVMNNEDQALQKKGKIYEEWLSDIDEQSSLREENLNSAKSEAIQEQLQEELDQLSKEKERVLTKKEAIDTKMAELDSDSKVELADNSEDEAVNSKEVITGDDEDSDLPEGYVEVDVAKVEANTPFPPGLQTFDFYQEYSYFSDNAQEPLKGAKVALYQAKKYDVSADEARKAAYVLPTPEERRKAFKDVNKFEKAALLREMEAMRSFGNVNQQEFYRNSSILKNVNDFDEDEIESNNLDLALLLQDEADTYFVQAEEVRAEAEADDLTTISQKNKLQKAYDLEMLALSKQKQALEALQLVDAEVEEGSAIENVSGRTTSNAKIQTITDPKVLSISSAKEAKVIGDEMNQKADSLLSEADRLMKSADVLTVGPERDSVMQLAEQKEDSASQLRSDAAVYYQRQGQLESGFIADASIDAGINKPPTKYTEAEFELDNLQVDESKRAVVAAKVEYDEFLTAAKSNHQQVKAAEIEYQKAVQLKQRQLELDQQAQALLQSAARESDPAEKERRVKEARVIELKADRLDKSIDSLNNIIKVKKFLVSTSENEMRKSIAGLSEEQQTEIAYFASRQIEEEEAEGTLESAEALAQEASPSDEATAESPQSAEDTNENQQTDPDNNAEKEADEVEEPLAQNDDTPATLNDANEGITEDEIGEKVETTETVEETGTKEAEVEVEVETTAVEEEIEAASNEGNDQIVETSEAENESEPAILNDIDAVPAQLNRPIFQILGSTNSAYDSDNPIPLMEDLPDGIVYKVQVGAFRNPISQDLFKGFAPLMAEPGPNGITRYSAGLFDTESAAIRARDQIRDLGYRDAFVIVFNDGERTNISSARNNEQIATGTANNTVNSVASNETPKNGYQFSNGVANVESIDEIFFSVQIGVFSKEVEGDAFDNYTDVNAVILPSGLIRYNAGIFDDLESAQNYKSVLSSEITDAFVVAYYQGKRISINNAARILNQNQ